MRLLKGSRLQNRLIERLTSRLNSLLIENYGVSLFFNIVLFNIFQRQIKFL